MQVLRLLANDGTCQHNGLMPLTVYWITTLVDGGGNRKRKNCYTRSKRMVHDTMARSYTDSGSRVRDGRMHVMLMYWDGNQNPETSIQKRRRSNREADDNTPHLHPGSASGPSQKVSSPLARREARHEAQPTDPTCLPKGRATLFASSLCPSVPTWRSRLQARDEL